MDLIQYMSFNSISPAGKGGLAAGGGTAEGAQATWT
jgi:hypothetical protein